MADDVEKNSEDSVGMANFDDDSDLESPSSHHNTADTNGSESTEAARQSNDDSRDRSAYASEPTKTAATPSVSTTALDSNNNSPGKAQATKTVRPGQVDTGVACHVCGENISVP